MPYTLHLNEFEGPLEKLLELIEAKKMDIATISLAEVTDDFLTYINTLEQKEARVLADFVSVGSKLILIKSKTLIPNLTLSATEEAGIHELETRLEYYKKLRDGARAINEALQTNTKYYSRALCEGIEMTIHPKTVVTPQMLEDALRDIDQSILTVTAHEKREIKKTLQTIEQVVEMVLARITQQGAQSFQTLAKGKERGEIIVLFLALLHLARRKLQLRQETAFNDILIE